MLPPEEPDIPDPDDPEEPDIPDPDDPDDFEEPGGEPEEPDEPLPRGEPGDALRPLWPLSPERLVSPASSSEADGERLLEALRELPPPGDALSRIPPCDEEPD